MIEGRAARGGGGQASGKGHQEEETIAFGHIWAPAPARTEQELPSLRSCSPSWLRTYCVPGAELGAGATAVDTGKRPGLADLTRQLMSKIGP